MLGQGRPWMFHVGCVVLSCLAATHHHSVSAQNSEQPDHLRHMLEDAELNDADVKAGIETLRRQFAGR